MPTTPTIHANGSRPDVLLEQYTDARKAVTNAFNFVAATAPNARDYYPQGDAAIAVATREHYARLDNFRAVLDDLDDIIDAIRAAVSERERMASL